MFKKLFVLLPVHFLFAAVGGSQCVEQGPCGDMLSQGSTFLHSFGTESVDDLSSGLPEEASVTSHDIEIPDSQCKCVPYQVYLQRGASCLFPDHSRAEIVDGYVLSLGADEVDTNHALRCVYTKCRYLAGNVLTCSSTGELAFALMPAEILTMLEQQGLLEKGVMKPWKIYKGYRPLSFKNYKCMKQIMCIEHVKDASQGFWVNYSTAFEVTDEARARANQAFLCLVILTNIPVLTNFAMEGQVRDGLGFRRKIESIIKESNLNKVYADTYDKLDVFVRVLCNMLYTKRKNPRRNAMHLVSHDGKSVSLYHDRESIKILCKGLSFTLELGFLSRLAYICQEVMGTDIASILPAVLLSDQLMVQGKKEVRKKKSQVLELLPSPYRPRSLHKPPVLSQDALSDCSTVASDLLCFRERHSVYGSQVTFDGTLSSQPTRISNRFDLDFDSSEGSVADSRISQCVEYARRESGSSRPVVGLVVNKGSLLQLSLAPRGGLLGGKGDVNSPDGGGMSVPQPYEWTRSSGSGSESSFGSGTRSKDSWPGLSLGVYDSDHSVESDDLTLGPFPFEKRGGQGVFASNQSVHRDPLKVGLQDDQGGHDVPDYPGLEERSQSHSSLAIGDVRDLSQKSSLCQSTLASLWNASGDSHRNSDLSVHVPIDGDVVALPQRTGLSDEPGVTDTQCLKNPQLLRHISHAHQGSSQGRQRMSDYPYLRHAVHQGSSQGKQRLSDYPYLRHVAHSRVKAQSGLIDEAHTPPTKMRGLGSTFKCSRSASSVLQCDPSDVQDVAHDAQKGYKEAGLKSKLKLLWGKTYDPAYESLPLKGLHYRYSSQEVYNPDPNSLSMSSVVDAHREAARLRSVKKHAVGEPSGGGQRDMCHVESDDDIFREYGQHHTQLKKSLTLDPSWQRRKRSLAIDLSLRSYYERKSLAKGRLVGPQRCRRFASTPALAQNAAAQKYTHRQYSSLYRIHDVAQKRFVQTQCAQPQHRSFSDVDVSRSSHPSSQDSLYDAFALLHLKQQRDSSKLAPIPEVNM